MNTSDDDRIRHLCLAALALDEPAPAGGERPSLDELWDWMAGQVPEPRATQIGEHVARDPRVHEQWRELRDALEEDQASSAVSDGHSRTERDAPRRTGWLESLSRWLSPPVYGGAFATVAVLGIAIGVARQPPEPDLWQDWQVLKTSGVLEVQQDEAAELNAFLVGMREQMRLMTLPLTGPQGRRLPDRIEPCGDSDTACVQRREGLRELGRLSVLSRFDCVLDNEWRPERQRRAAELLAVLGEQGSLARLRAPWQAWAAADDTIARCNAIDELLARGLTGLDAHVS